MLKKELLLPGIRNLKSFANALPQVPKIQKELLLPGIRNLKSFANALPQVPKIQKELLLPGIRNLKSFANALPQVPKIQKELLLPGIRNLKSFANALPQVPKIEKDILRTGISIWETEKIRQIKALKPLRILPLEIEKMRLQKFERDLEVLQASLNQISQMPQSTRILPQGAAKAISEAKPPKKKKAEPMSSDDYEDDPYVHVHCIC